MGLAGVLGGCGTASSAGDAKGPALSEKATTHVVAAPDAADSRHSSSKQGTIVSINRGSGTLELAVDLTWPPFAVQTTPRRDTVIVTAHTRFVPRELRFSNLRVGDAVAVTTSFDAKGQQQVLVLTRLILD